MLVDTHTHIILPEFDDDRDDVIRRARDAGVKRMIVIGIDVETSRTAIALAARYEGVYATVGIHPNEAAHAAGDDFDRLARLARDPGVVGIGETGLDFYRSRAPADVQVEAFRRHIRLARQCGLPVVVHDREAHDAVLEVLREERAAGTGVALHCFTGDTAMAATALEAGYFLSFGGLVTFKNTPLAAVVPHVPLDRLLVETDAPYLSPAPYRGRRNEPARVVHTAEAVARLHGVPLEDVAAATTRNASTLFGRIS